MGLTIACYAAPKGITFNQLHLALWSVMDPKRVNKKRLAAISRAMFSLAALLLLCHTPPLHAAPVAVKGVLDLGAWDFKIDGPVLLNGEWCFHWGNFLPPESLRHLKKLPGEVAAVPSVWSSVIYKNRKLHNKGLGTYHLRVRLSHRPELLALKLPTAGTAYNLYVNGKKIAYAGKIGKSRETMTPAYRPQITTFAPEDDILDIVIHMSNFNYRWGGQWYSPVMGEPRDIRELREDNIIKEAFLTGIFFIMFIYHIMLVLLRKIDGFSLVFSMVCIILCVRQASIGEIIALNLFPFISFKTIIRLEYLTFFAVVPVISTFLLIAFPRAYSKTISMGVIIVGGIFCGIVVSTPVEFFSSTITVYQVFTIACIFYGLRGIIRSVIEKLDGAIILSAGFAVLFIAAINDILYARQIIDTGHMSGYGLLCLIFCQAFLVNHRFSKAFTAVETLSGMLEEKNRDLTDLTQNLERIVEDRTCALKEAYVEIKKLAFTDPLTGLSNRRSILKIIGQEERRLERNRTPLSIGLLDIDDFKSVNDTYGHDCGDTVLVAIAGSLDNILRKQDRAARWGGEEFLLAFPDTDTAGAMIVANKLKKQIGRKKIFHSGHLISVTVTIGICQYHEDLGIGGTIKLADEALYKGKRKGKDCVVSAASPDRIR